MPTYIQLGFWFVPTSSSGGELNILSKAYVWSRNKCIPIGNFPRFCFGNVTETNVIGLIFTPNGSATYKSVSQEQLKLISSENDPREKDTPFV